MEGEEAAPEQSKDREEQDPGLALGIIFTALWSWELLTCPEISEIRAPVSVRPVWGKSSGMGVAVILLSLCWTCRKMCVQMLYCGIKALAMVMVQSNILSKTAFLFLAGHIAHTADTMMLYTPIGILLIFSVSAMLPLHSEQREVSNKLCMPAGCSADVYGVLKNFAQLYQYFLFRHNKGAKSRVKRYTEGYKQR